MAGIDSGLAALGQAFERVTDAQTAVGLDLSRLHRGSHPARPHAARRRSAPVAVAEDANLAESISGMTQADAAHRAALGALANAGRLSLMDYLK